MDDGGGLEGGTLAVRGGGLDVQAKAMAAMSKKRSAPLMVGS